MQLASVGIIARNHTSQVIISSWDFIGLCSCVDEAEFRMCLAGLYVGISLSKLIILESDCSLWFSILQMKILTSPQLLILR